MTHYFRHDQPGWDSRLCRAVCGALGDPRRDLSATPECPECHAWIHQDDGKTAEDLFGPPADTRTV